MEHAPCAVQSKAPQASSAKGRSLAKTFNPRNDKSFLRKI
jgi:hypothetical protein